MALTPTQEAQVLQLVAEQAALLSLADNEATIISKLGATKVNLSSLGSAATFDDADIMLIRQGTTDLSIAGSVVKAAIGVPDASETVKGKVELATSAETIAGTDAVRAVHPLGFKTAGSALWAALVGLSSQVFSVGVATLAAHATRFDQVFGLGQTWQTVTRVAGTTYTNSTGKPIQVAIVMGADGVNSATFSINGSVVATSLAGSGSRITWWAIIPDGATYVVSITTGNPIIAFSEFR